MFFTLSSKLVSVVSGLPNFSAAAFIPAFIVSSSSPSNPTISLFAASTSLGDRSSKPLTRRNSDAAFG